MLNFDRTIGAAAPAAAATVVPASRRDLPKANLWLNIGYTVILKMTDGTTEERFVSIPVGIPVDTMEPINITSRNTEYAQLQAAQNDLLAQLKAAGASKQPGEAVIVPGLECQLRRVNGPVEAPPADATNPFAHKLSI